MGLQRIFKVVLVVTLLALPVESLRAVLGDIVFQIDDEARGTTPAVFPHWVHRVRYKCYACHPAVFEMKAGANPVTMDAIAAGQYCGSCHDGNTAWGVGFDTCNRCHFAE
jgi:c(7)-type cytochrome triheme protein